MKSKQECLEMLYSRLAKLQDGQINLMTMEDNIMNWQTFTIVINGEISKIKAVSAEMAVSSLMCWYSHNTLFIVFDEKGNVSTFKNIVGSNIEGTKLIKINVCEENTY